MRAPRPGRRRLPLLVYGLLLGAPGLTLCLLVALAALLGATGWSLPFLAGVAALAIASVALGTALALIDLFVLLPGKLRQGGVRVDPPRSTALTVVLTAYEDETSIGLAVKDFLAHPAVRRVIVVDNASRDSTSRAAAEAGAQVVVETEPGYGSCVHRALREGAQHEDTELVLLCEGDCTFRAFDIEKFLAYIPHADVVNGTRIVEQLRSPQTQLTTFMYYGNFFVGKLLEAKHLGAGTFTDVGTTYKLCRREALHVLLPLLQPEINLEFNAHFLDVALATGLRLVECPITFFPRVGKSKGGNTDDWRALSVGLRMIRGLLLGWPARRT